MHTALAHCRKYALTLSALFLSVHAVHAFESDAKQAILKDVQTNTIVYGKNADEQVGPSSMSKMMTVYLLLERIKQGSVTLEDEFFVSEKAWKMGGSKMFVKVGSSVKVEDLLRGIAIQSGNDACVVVAEALAGSEENFAQMANEKAAELGLTDSHFANATGWPAEDHYMTVRDIAKLAEALVRDFPEYYHYWQEREFTYNGIRQYNRNTLLGKLGVDGLKTGHTDAAGYGIAVSGEQDGRRLVAVVNGLDSTKGRISAARALMSYGFTNFQNIKLLEAGQMVGTAKSWLGSIDEVPLVVAEDAYLTLPVVSSSKPLIQLRVQEPVKAPVAKGTPLGTLEINASGIEPISLPVYAGVDVEKLSAFQRIMPVLKYRLFGAY